MLVFNNLKEMEPYYNEKTNTYKFVNDEGIREDVQFNFQLNISTRDINAEDINARDINAGNINAGNIDAGNINAGNINYYAVCFSHSTFKCKSVNGRRINSKHFCLDSDIEYK